MLDRGDLPESWAWFLTLSMDAYVLSVVVMLWIATVRFRRGRVTCGRMRAYRAVHDWALVVVVFPDSGRARRVRARGRKRAGRKPRPEQSWELTSTDAHEQNSEPNQVSALPNQNPVFRRRRTRPGSKRART